MSTHVRGGMPRRILLRMAVAACGGFCPRALAQMAVRREAVEAAYLHKLPGFVEWPAQAFASASSPIVVGLAGAPAVYEELVRIAKGRLVAGRSVEPRVLEAVADAPHDLHVLFIGAEAVRTARALVEVARARHALVVTDLPDGLEAGAAVQFVEVDGRVRLQISLSGARKCSVKLRSQLMGVAYRVTEDGE